MHKRTMQDVVRTACALAILGITPAYATSRIQNHIPSAQKVGQGRLTYMFWDVYDATLYAPEGSWKEGKPLALQLSYLRNLSGKKIADRSVQEIRQQGFDNEVKLATWHSQMRSIFPDVSNGVVLTGVYTAQGTTIFYLGDQEIGTIKDPEFGQAFFNIWLSNKTTAPDLRRKLLGTL